MTDATSGPPRITPLPDAERDSRALALLAEFVVPPTENIYATMVRHPDVLERCIPLGRQLRSGRLSLRQRELLILRTGWLCHSRYELTQHTRLALGGGMTADEVERIRTGPAAPGWTPQDVALLTAADELHRDAVISDVTWAGLASYLDTQQLMEVPMVCGYYHLVSYFLNSLRIEVEPEATASVPASLLPEVPAGG